MRVLLLGGTGTMGKHLAFLLSLDKNNTVCITSRKVHTDADNVHYFIGNGKDMAFLREITSRHEKWDAIVDFMIYSTEEFRQRCGFLLSMTRQYLFLSSARVYADSDSPLSEQSSRLIDSVDDPAFLHSGNYAVAKAQQEDLLLESDMRNWTIIRPYITYSSDKMQLGLQEKEEWLYRVFHDRSIVFPRELLDKKTTMTWGDDVARALLKLIGNQKTLGEIYHIANEQSVTWREVLDCYTKSLNSLGYKANVVFVETIEKTPKDLYRAKYDRLLDREFSMSKIAEIYDCSDFLRIEQGLPGCLKTFVKDQEFRGINWITQGKLDRITGERAKWSEMPSARQKLDYFFARYLFYKEK